MKTFQQFVTEGRRTEALLPATKALWNKNKVGIDDIAKQWGKGKYTVQVAHVHGSEWERDRGGKPKLRFVVGSGHGGYDDKFHAHHDQTGAKAGYHHIVNNVHIEDGKVVHQDNDLHVNDKAAVHVYK